VAATVASAINVDIASEANFVTQQVGTSEFDGDLLTFVDLGPFRDYFGPHPEIIDTYSTDLVDTASTGLFGDTEISVALVGTSYSARTDFHFEGFLKSQLGADIVNHADIGRGPFEPMEAFLAGLGETGSAPRIVIWEIPERYVATWGDT
jgi:alginate O-acetyltransferase complex protein AlgJ